jgi:glycogen debranching enzyme
MDDVTDTLVVKAGNLFAITPRDGGLPAGVPHALGLFRDDTRYLSVHELRVDGARLRLLAASDDAGDTAAHELMNPELRRPDGRQHAPQTLRVRLARQVRDDRLLEERVALQSYALEPVEIEVTLALAADFETVLALRGLVALPPPARTARATPDGALLEGRGRDGRRRCTRVTAEPRPDPGDQAGVLRWRLALAPGEARELRLRYELDEEGEGHTRPRRAGPRGERAQACVDDPLLGRALARSLADLELLRSHREGLRYYAAGIPWYATLFGRDSLITALQTVGWDRDVAAETLRLLAAHQGTRLDDAHDEEPGKIPHELRFGELARLDVTPLARYYGTVDATPLFLCLLEEHADWAGDLALARELRDAMERALEWIDRWGDLDGDGLLEYRARAPQGLRNQGWKDSVEGVPDAAGHPLAPPVALVEAQGYVVRAKRAAARLLAADGEPARAEALRGEAAAMEERLERFWLPERSAYAMALGPAKRPSPVLGSNQGHLLWATQLPDERARAVRDALLSDALWSGWGVRTMGAREPGYNPLGYHLGTVWPHDNALIALGVRSHGFDDAFLAIFEGLLAAAAGFPGSRLPELFAGYPRAETAVPVPYPVACQPQAWAAGTIPCLLLAGLGLHPDGLARRLHVRRPLLPRGTDRLALRGLRLGEARIDLRFARTEGQVVVAEARVEGDAEVVVDEDSSGLERAAQTRGSWPRGRPRPA